MQICIIRPPTGEAPEWVRTAWIGILFPDAIRSTQPRMGFGVLTGPRTYLGQRIALLLGRGQRTAGYLVEAKAAVEALETHAPQAARWWRENAPHMLAPKKYFNFDTDACQEL